MKTASFGIFSSVSSLLRYRSSRSARTLRYLNIEKKLTNVLYFFRPMKPAKISVYRNIACMDMFLIAKIPVYMLINPCAKFTLCACARLVAHKYQGPSNLLRMRKQVWIFNGRRSNQSYARNTLSMYTNVCRNTLVQWSLFGIWKTKKSKT